MKNLFDAEQGKYKKMIGMESSANKRLSDLDLARQIAVRLASEKGYATADSVGQIMLDEHNIQSLGGAAGSIFAGSEWEFTGRRVPSRRTTNNGREIKVWRLRGACNTDTPQVMVPDSQKFRDEAKSAAQEEYPFSDRDQYRCMIGWLASRCAELEAQLNTEVQDEEKDPHQPTHHPQQPQKRRVPANDHSQDV